ncbi:hypothetical protein AMTR_s00075p00167470 [Amborella trichopoda]|uniref:Uncharacterized protein n=1 Tax=Amborella trichopoda TaxID=13333 RepID=W1PAI3_AMBTC|nr:hypothetical protein AMTR_s00075p00167470 [Amborella trichopoda]
MGGAQGCLRSERAAGREVAAEVERTVEEEDGKKGSEGSRRWAAVLRWGRGEHEVKVESSDRGGD